MRRASPGLGQLMKALVTGFEPFGGDRVNPSFEALQLLPSRVDGIDIATQALPVVFGAALPALRNAIAATGPDIVLCVGLAGGRTELSLERVAVNIDDARIADNEGNQPVDQTHGQMWRHVVVHLAVDEQELSLEPIGQTRVGEMGLGVVVHPTVVRLCP